MFVCVRFVMFVCVYMGFLIFGCVQVWVFKFLVCLCVGLIMFWCLFVDFVICGCVCVCVVCVKFGSVNV